MSAFTVNRIFSVLLEYHVLAEPRRGTRYGRRERVSSVFPERVCDRIAARSASYYSWFLNMDRQGAPIRSYLRALFEEDSYEVLLEMEQKCRLLLEPGKEPGCRTDSGAWRELLDLLGQEVPIFVRGGEAAGRLEGVAGADPSRGLACLFLIAGMDGCTSGQFERILHSWELMNRNPLQEDDGEPLRRIRTAELLYLDGNRKEALRMMKQAAESLRSMIRDCDRTAGEPETEADTEAPSGRETEAGTDTEASSEPAADAVSAYRSQLGQLLLRIGALCVHGGEDGEHSGEGEEEAVPYALRCLRESVENGCVQANGLLAELALGEGRLPEAESALLRGARAGDTKCLRMLGNAFYRGDPLAGSRRDLPQAVRYYLAGACPEDSADSAAGDALCQYMLGRILEEIPLTASADQGKAKEETGAEDSTLEMALSLLSQAQRDPAYWYAAAARKGNAEAAVRLNRLSWRASGRGAFTDAGERRHAHGRKPARKRICLLNSASEKNLLFARSLPEKDYLLFICGETCDRRGAEKDGAFREKAAGDGDAGDLSPVSADPARNMARLLSRIGADYLDLAAAMVRRDDPQDRSRSAGRQQELREQAAAPDPGTMTGKDPVQWLWEVFPEILCVALDEDGQKNLRDGLQVLREAYLLHERSAELLGIMEEPASGPVRGMSVGYGAAGTAAESPGDPVEGAPESREDRLFYLLSDRVKLYVMEEEAYAAPLLDSACSRLGDFYLPLQICDPAKMASAWLLDRLPLFIPCIQDIQEDRRGRLQEDRRGRLQEDRRGRRPLRMETVIFGDHPGIVQMCKDILAAAQIEDPERFPFSLTVVSENAEDLEERFLTDCPGLADPKADKPAAAPLFVKMKPESSSLQCLLQNRDGLFGGDAGGKSREGLNEEREQEIRRRIRSAGYLIVYAQEERRNLSLAMFLREWYLKTDPTFTRLPMIACYCENGLVEEQIRTLCAGAEKAGADWFNNYRIEAFGAAERMFSYQELVLGRLERTALACHFSWYSFTVRRDRYRAEHDYYVRTYNRDSSRMNALSLPYRLFSAGITFADWHDYTADLPRDSLADRFASWLRAGDLQEKGEFLREDTGGGKDGQDPDTSMQRERERRLEQLAVREHGRWNRFMLSRGWMRASTEQMLAYLQRGNGRQQLYIAKLHPFLCSWEQLERKKGSPAGIQETFDSVMRQIHPDHKAVDIQEIDRENVRKTAQILRA